jgi:hypothetical protein
MHMHPGHEGTATPQMCAGNCGMTRGGRECISVPRNQVASRVSPKRLQINSHLFCTMSIRSVISVPFMVVGSRSFIWIPLNGQSGWDPGPRSSLTSLLNYNCGIVGECLQLLSFRNIGVHTGEVLKPLVAICPPLKKAVTHCKQGVGVEPLFMLRCDRGPDMLTWSTLNFFLKPLRSLTFSREWRAGCVSAATFLRLQQTVHLVKKIHQFFGVLLVRSPFIQQQQTFFFLVYQAAPVQGEGY